MDILNKLFPKYSDSTIKLDDDYIEKIHVSAASHVGNVREKNEDSFSINGICGTAENGLIRVSEDIRADSALFIVCDGMGGEGNGDIASSIAVGHSAELYSELNSVDEPGFSEIVIGYVNKVNSEICRTLNNTAAHRSGSTLAIVYIRDSVAYTFSLGDSRIYLFENGELTQISIDHTLAMRKYLANIYTLEEAETSNDRHKLTLFLGVDVEEHGLKAETYEPIRLEPGQKLLICSDGLYDMCSKQEIIEILSGGSDDCSRELVGRALANGGIDNVTSIVLKLRQA